ncbi:hypothetical protein [Candidatus Symbiopectobacterium sp. NZEC135]|uniref:hypothetical protein n=1 Tax=Candidatus Symbiopectobacterium sp. NZEC135 TaxID=2820471 RepID=UPI002227ACD3|nr:hypothetical protein [Candidatus Symbiopectobacterium sp. NZEC135]MCW2478112.1 hypothetical protein [Candidatus Symbiopectobacterium sp. NZEC135]
MDGTITIILCVVGVLGFFWTLYRDKKRDGESLTDRVTKLESETALVKQSISTLKTEQEAIKDNLEKLEEQLTQINQNIVRILTILDK